MNIDHTKRHLKSLGIILSEAPGEYRLRYLHGTQERIAEDLQEAMCIGTNMAKWPHPQAPELPPGPLPKKTRRSFIRGHNLRRLKAKEKAKRAKAEAEVTAMLQRNSIPAKE